MHGKRISGGTYSVWSSDVFSIRSTGTSPELIVDIRLPIFMVMRLFPCAHIMCDLMPDKRQFNPI